MYEYVSDLKPSQTPVQVSAECLRVGLTGAPRIRTFALRGRECGRGAARWARVRAGQGLARELLWQPVSPSRCLRQRPPAPRPVRWVAGRAA